MKNKYEINIYFKDGSNSLNKVRDYQVRETRDLICIDIVSQKDDRILIRNAIVLRKDSIETIEYFENGKRTEAKQGIDKL